jgi:hypothetical protein
LIGRISGPGHPQSARPGGRRVCKKGVHTFVQVVKSLISLE